MAGPAARGEKILNERRKVIRSSKGAFTEPNSLRTSLVVPVLETLQGVVGLVASVTRRSIYPRLFPLTRHSRSLWSTQAGVFITGTDVSPEFYLIIR